MHGRGGEAAGEAETKGSLGFHDQLVYGEQQASGSMRDLSKIPQAGEEALKFIQTAPQ